MKKLSSNKLSEYITALEEIRNKLDRNEEIKINPDQFKHICKIYSFYKTGSFKDLNILHKKIMDLFLKHEDFLKGNPEAKDSFSAVLKYTYGCMNGIYDGSGFAYLGGNSLELCTSIELRKIVTVLQKDFPQDARIFEQYLSVLKSIEGAYHTTYWILRRIANQHIKELKPILFSIEPVFKSYVLHAMDEFVGDTKVISLYQEYISTFEKIKTESTKQNVKDECSALVDEAKEYLNKVKK